jgi:hypothetical protein
MGAQAGVSAAKPLAVPLAQDSVEMQVPNPEVEGGVIYVPRGNRPHRERFVPGSP